MDNIQDLIKIYVSRKWLENVNHIFSDSELIINNKTCIKYEISLTIYQIKCEGIGETVKSAKEQTLKHLFKELKLKSLITEEIVFNILGIDKHDHNCELQLQLISQRILNEGPTFKTRKTKSHKDIIYQVGLGHVFFDIKGTMTEVIKIIYYMIVNGINRIFGKADSHLVSKSSIVGVKLLPKPSVSNDQENVTSLNNCKITSMAMGIKSVPKPTDNTLKPSSSVNISNGECTDVKTSSRSNFILNMDAPYVKLFLSKSLPLSTINYLGELIENAVANQDKMEKTKITEKELNDIWLKDLKKSVSVVLNEMLVTNDITVEEYDVLTIKIVEKVIVSSEKRIDFWRIREFIPIYLNSYREKVAIAQ